MQDFLDFLSWLGFTILAAAIFGFSDVVGSTGLTGPELMTLGLCASLAGGSIGFLLCHWVARGAGPTVELDSAPGIRQATFGCLPV